MTKDTQKLALLPNGFVDLLPPDAEREYAAIGKMMMTFAAFGYERVKPPLLEFEDSLFAPGPGAAMFDDTFRVMDPISHRMMGVRSDITAQIARIASSRLGEERRPLRLCYANDVLRTKASQQRTERQFCQVGCEIIGDENVETDIESCVVALIGLKEIGVKNITIDLAYPRIINQLLDKHKVSDDDCETIKKALERRSVESLKQHKALGSSLGKLIKVAGPADKAIKALAAMPEFKSDAQKLKTIYEGVARAIKELGFKDVKITIDPAEMRGFKYYSGLGFTLFAGSVAGAMGRGGRYDVHFGGKKPAQSATGFTLYMDTVRKAMSPAVQKKVVSVSTDTDWSDIRSQQKQGTVVVRGKRKK